LPVFKPRLKAPPVIALTSVQPQVLAALAPFNQDKPAHTFKYLRLTGTSTMKGKTSNEFSEQFISPDAASGQLSIAHRGDGYESQSVSWRNLIQLVSKSTFGGAGMAQSNADPVEPQR
jgi:hypothetical protein